jgi:hypothetical protein
VTATGASSTVALPPLSLPRFWPALSALSALAAFAAEGALAGAAGCAAGLSSRAPFFFFWLFAPASDAAAAAPAVLPSAGGTASRPAGSAASATAGTANGSTSKGSMAAASEAGGPWALAHASGADCSPRPAALELTLSARLVRKRVLRGTTCIVPGTNVTLGAVRAPGCEREMGWSLPT